MRGRNQYGAPLKEGPAKLGQKEYQRRKRARYRALAIAGYGGKCMQCGESDPRVLELDHINGGGNEHRRNLGGGSAELTFWVVKNNYPCSIQLLCANCHRRKMYLDLDLTTYVDVLHQVYGQEPTHQLLQDAAWVQSTDSPRASAG